jgi:uncharacterized protein YegL
MDDRELVPGERWERRLEEALRSSDAILFVLSGDVSEQNNVFFELGFAKALGKRSIFIVPENYDLKWIPFDLRNEEIVSKKSPDETAAALAAALSFDYNQSIKSSLSRRQKEEPFVAKTLLFKNVEYIENPEARLACVLLLDTSGSMAGQPIVKLNTSFAAFIQTMRKNEIAALRIDIAVISFGTEVHIMQEFTSPSEIRPVYFKARGTTGMGRALQSALEMLLKRKELYAQNGIPYYRPWLFLITDGTPTDDWQEAAKQVRQGAAAGEFHFFGVGVEGADMETLSQIATPNTPPLKLRGLDFQSLFLWLSSSLVKVTSCEPISSNRDPISLPPVDWAVNM